MNYYSALDVSLRSIHICVMDEKGSIKAEGQTLSEVEDVIAFLRNLDVEITSVGFEAGTLTQYLTYGLQAADYDVVCMEARQVKAALSAMRNKTDKNDARGIAQVLRSGWYSRVHVKSIESHQIRALLSSRKAVMSKCIDLENEIRGLFKVFGIKLPPKLGHGSFDAAVRDIIEDDPALSHALLPMLDVRLQLYHAFRELDNRTRKMAHQDPVCQRLMSVPGVGFVTSLTFKAAVDDPTRFKRSRTVAAHFGLTPRRFQSGEMDRVCNSPNNADIDAPSSRLPANSPLSFTVYGSTSHSSAGDRKEHQYELITPPRTPTVRPLRGRGLDEAESDCCA
jgi:transposase